MVLTCDRCKRDSGLDGIGSGWWKCGPCVAEIEAERKAGAILRTAEARAEIAAGRRTALIPGHALPPETTDAEAQRFADEHYGIEWERRDGKVIVWCEM